MAKLKIHARTQTHTHCAAHQGVKRAPFVVFTYSLFAKSRRHEQALTLRQLALLLFYMISLCDLFSNSNHLTLKTHYGFISTLSAVFASNFITLSNSAVLKILLATNVTVAFLSTVVSAAFYSYCIQVSIQAITTLRPHSAVTTMLNFFSSCQVTNHRTSSMSSLNSQESSNDICKLTDKQQAEYRDAYREYIAQMAQVEMSGSGGERPVQPHPGQFLQTANSEDKGVGGQSQKRCYVFVIALKYHWLRASAFSRPSPTAPCTIICSIQPIQTSATLNLHPIKPHQSIMIAV